MQINTLKRPWEKPHRQGTRYNPDPHYQSKGWKNTRAAFRQSYTEVNGVRLPNIYCIDCFTEHGVLKEGSETDHDKRRKDGGTDNFDNLRTRCKHHHAIKSAKEGNELRKDRIK